MGVINKNDLADFILAKISFNVNNSDKKTTAGTRSRSRLFLTILFFLPYAVAVTLYKVLSGKLRVEPAFGFVFTG